jgi:hypothetical protein
MCRPGQVITCSANRRAHLALRAHAPAISWNHCSWPPTNTCLAAETFLLSPANSAGRRAALLLGGRGNFPLAQRLTAGEAVPLGEAFSFLSGLYFRGKLAYARQFAAPAGTAPGALVITTNRGLLLPDTPVTREDLAAFGGVPIDLGDDRYRAPLERDALGLAAALPADACVVLLGSIASGKYVDLLADIFGERLLFPEEFVGRGDMSRGGLMLRCVDSGDELTYVPVLGATRRGRRPPRLEPRR